MFLPIKTEIDARRRPVVTESIIAVNMLVYIAALAGNYWGWFDYEQFYRLGQVSRWEFNVHQLFTSQFMHDQYGLGHLFFNMIALWVFGCPVEDRMGRLGYLIFYLLGGATAGLAHIWNTTAPAIGASGAIAAITGAYLAMFPRSRVRVISIFGLFVVPALWIIGLYFTLDVLRQTGQWLGAGQARVAFMAHIGGYLFGFFVAFALLGFKIVKHDECDVFFLFKQRRRRRALTAVTKNQIAGVWDAPTADSTERRDKQAEKAKPMTEAEKAVAETRSHIIQLIDQHKLDEAAAEYGALLDTAPEETLPESRQLDIAMQLHQQGDYAHAAAACELLLKRFPRSPKAPEVNLILAIIYTRHLLKPERAKETIAVAKERLADSAQLGLADQLLAELAS